MGFLQNFANNKYLSQYVYDSVLDKLEIPEDDLFFRNQIQIVYEDSLADHVVLATLEHADETELQALYDYKNNVYNVNPALSESEIVMEFLMIYKQLCDKVFQTIPEFSSQFVDDFNQINGVYGK